MNLSTHPPLVAAQRGSQVARFWTDPPTPVPKPCSWNLHSLSTSPAHPDDASTTRSARPSVGGGPRRGWLHQSVCRTCTRVRPCPSIPSSDGTALQPRIRRRTPPSAVHSLVRLRHPSSALQKKEADRGSENAGEAARNMLAYIEYTLLVMRVT